MSPDLSGWPRTARAPRLVAAAYVAAFVLAQAAVAAGTGFHPAVNDVLGIVSIAQGIDWGDLSTLHNGFFPIGLPVLFAVLPLGSWLAVGAIASLTAGAVTLGATWFVASRLAGAWWALLAVVALSVDPAFFAYVASPGPDVIAVGFATAGIAVYVGEATTRRPAVRPWVVLCAGALFGIAGLFRYHAILVGVGLLAWCVLRRERRLALLGAAVAGLAIGYAPQVVVNLLGGFGPLANDGGFTMYQSVVDINWLTTGSIDRAAYSSAWTVVADHPSAFAAAYAASAAVYAVPVALAATAVLVRRRAHTGRVLVSLLVAAVGYAAVVSTGNSPRGVLAVAPITAVAIAVIADRVFDLTRPVAPDWQRIVAMVALAGAVVVLPSVSGGLSAIVDRQAQERDRAAVEDAVVRYDVADTAASVLTNDFNLYFDDLPGITPDPIGGWTAVSRNGDQPHRDVDLSSVRAFVCDAAGRGIQLVLWSPGNVVPGMDDDLAAALTGTAPATGLRAVGPIGSYQATAVEPGFLCP